MLVRVLGRTYDVLALSSVEEALDHIAAGERFDLVLCDILLPKLTGMEFHERAFVIAPELAERTVFMTGGAFMPRAEAFLNQPGIRHLEKPFSSIDGLRAAVREHLDRLAGSRS
jgi:CheY-like chemotaxis protein